jgi:hypothetical protein
MAHFACATAFLSKLTLQTMKTKTLTLLLVGASLLAAPRPAHAQDFVTPIVSSLSALGGGAIGQQFVDQWEYAPILGASLAPLIVDFGLNIFKSKNEKEKIDFYIAGRNYERWIQTQSPWFQSTLDPYTGRPPAFSGLNEMDAGIPKTEMANPSQVDIAQTFSIPVKMPAGDYQGIPRTERIVPFPKLP